MSNPVADAAGTVATYTYYGGTLGTVNYTGGSKYLFGAVAIGANFAIATVKDAQNKILEHHAYDSQRRATTSELLGSVEKYSLNYVSDTRTDVVDALGRTTVYTLDKNARSGRSLKLKANALAAQAAMRNKPSPITSRANCSRKPTR